MFWQHISPFSSRKRYSARLSHRWDVWGLEPAEEEHPRPEYLHRLRGASKKTVNYVTGAEEPK